MICNFKLGFEKRMMSGVNYDLHMSENTMLGETIKSDARAELLNILRKTGERGKMNDGTGK
jgi:hypothetical protein